MSSTRHFSVPTALAFVVAGIAAVVLATIITLGGYGRSKPSPARVAPAPSSGDKPPSPAPSSADAPRPAEYWLDVSDVKDPAKLP